MSCLSCTIHYKDNNFNLWVLFMTAFTNYVFKTMENLFAILLLELIYHYWHSGMYSWQAVLPLLSYFRGSLFANASLMLEQPYPKTPKVAEMMGDAKILVKYSVTMSPSIHQVEVTEIQFSALTWQRSDFFQDCLDTKSWSWLDKFMWIFPNALQCTCSYHHHHQYYPVLATWQNNSGRQQQQWLYSVEGWRNCWGT